MQVSTEVTVLMQKAIYYVSRLIAARGVLEMTDRSLNFDVSSLDASFGIKDVSIEIDSITDVRIECGDLHPRIIVLSEKGKFEFVLSRGQELYDMLKSRINNPILSGKDAALSDLTLKCKCGREVNSSYRFCPWCGERM